MLGSTVTILALVASVAAEAAPPVTAARLVILSDNVVGDDGVGEWGFAALVEANGRRILFDTGAHPETVLRNAKTLGIDLSSVTEVVLSHWHDDHTGGLVALRRELSKRNRAALGVAHVGRGFFWPRREGGKALAGSLELRTAFEAAGGRFVEHAAPGELAPGVWVTGQVQRRTSERNFPKGVEVQPPGAAWREDDVPDDMSLVLDSTEGLIVVTGCGHAGVVNTLEAARAGIREGRVDAVVGGLHLYETADADVDWTGGELRRLGVAHLVGAHCTGIEPLQRLRRTAGLTRATAVVGSVGASFTLGKGIDPGLLSR